MIVTLSMRAKTRREVTTTGQAVDYAEVLEGQAGARLLSVFDKGRCAKLEVDDSRLPQLKQVLGERFVVSRNVQFEPFARRKLSPKISFK